MHTDTYTQSCCIHTHTLTHTQTCTHTDTQSCCTHTHTHTHRCARTHWHTQSCCTHTHSPFFSRCFPPVLLPPQAPSQMDYLPIALPQPECPPPLCARVSQGAGLPKRLSGKASTCSEGALGSTPRSGRSPGEGNSNPFQYPVWEIPWTEEPGGLQFTRLQRVRHDLVTEQQQEKSNGSNILKL